MMKLDRTIAPKVKALTNVEFLHPMNITLSNGIPLNVIDVGVQDVVRMDVLFEGGQWLQKQKLQSLFTNRMLREGTASFSSYELSRQLDFYGSWMEFANYPKYTSITLYSLNKYIDKTLALLHSAITEPLFPEKELTTLKDRSKQQFLVHLSKVSFLANRLLFKSLYGEEHPLGIHTRQEDFDAMNVKLLQSYHQDHYHSAGCSFYLSGKISTGVLQSVEAILGKESFGVKKEFTPATFSCTTSDEKRVTLKKDSAMQNAVRLGALTISHNHSDYLKLRVLVTLFGGYFGSRLMSNIREDKGYTYGISASLIPYSDSTIFMIASDTDPNYVEALIQEVYYEMDRLKSEKVSEEELSKVKNYMIGDLCRNYETAFSIADAWLTVKTSALSSNYFEEMLKAIEEVTVDDIYKLANRYFSSESMREVVVGK